MAHDAPKKVNRAFAARAFEVCAGLDPSGIETPASAAMRGECFVLHRPTGRAVYSLEIAGGCAWIVCAAGTGSGMTAAGLAAIEAQAKAGGCQRVGFQTMRRGLVRQAVRLGYTATKKLNGYQLSRHI